MNKYPVLRHTWQTVIIETDNCHSEFSEYSLEQATHVLQFSIEKWFETIATNRFKSVIYFKNHGPMSGGSIRHPHSQIVGLYDHDYREYVKPHHFAGPLAYEGQKLTMTISDHPMIGFFEFNLIAKKDITLPFFAHQLQGVLRYILGAFSRHVTSYNIFFYQIQDDYIHVKVVPRFITTPLFVGYGIPQVTCPDRVQEVIHDLQNYLHY